MNKAQKLPNSKSTGSSKTITKRDSKSKKQATKSVTNYSHPDTSAAEDGSSSLSLGDSMIQAILDDDQLTKIDEDLIESYRPRLGNTSISLSILTKRCLGDQVAQDSENTNRTENLMQRLNEVTHARLDREGITQIDGLELIGNVRNLYLQHNSIAAIENLEFLSNLTFLCLSNNKICELNNLSCLYKLGLLDLSHNLIEAIDENELPTSLLILDLRGNPCSALPTYRDAVLRVCQKLSQLDGERLGIGERRNAGQDVETDSDSDEDHIRTSTDNEETTPRPTPFDAEIIGVFEDLSTDIFLRCQSRIQQVLTDHSDRESRLEDIRSQPGMREALSSRASTNFDEFNTPRINSPVSGSSSQSAATHNDE